MRPRAAVSIQMRSIGHCPITKICAQRSLRTLLPSALKAYQSSSARRLDRLAASIAALFPSELARGFAVLPLECLVERRFGCVADGEGDPTKAVVLFTEQACRTLHADTNEIRLRGFADNLREADGER